MIENLKCSQNWSRKCLKRNIKMNDFKKVVLFLKSNSLLISTTKIWKCNAWLKDDSLDKLKLRQFENRSIKLKKADLDLTFLSNYQTSNVILKFLAYNLPYTNNEDSRFIKKRLLRSAIRKRRDERCRLEKLLENIRTKFVPSYQVLINILYCI